MLTEFLIDFGRAFNIAVCLCLLAPMCVGACAYFPGLYLYLFVYLFIYLLFNLFTELVFFFFLTYLGLVCCLPTCIKKVKFKLPSTVPSSTLTKKTLLVQVGGLSLRGLTSMTRVATAALLPGSVTVSNRPLYEVAVS